MIARATVSPQKPLSKIPIGASATAAPYRSGWGSTGDAAADPPGRVAGVGETRIDGRTPDQLRTVRFQRGWTEHAEGSVLCEFGRTRVLCTASVLDTVPRWRRGSGKGWVNPRIRDAATGDVDPLGS